MELKDKKIGLALGGGAVLGAAHLGVLKAIHELEIPIHAIAGTSIGALVSGFYAFNSDCKALESLVLDLNWGDVSSLSFSKFGLFNNTKMQDLIKSELGEVNIEDASTQLAIVATDISSGEKEVLSEGSVSEAIMASACIPGIYKPVRMNGKLLVDGGIVENVPISPLLDMGADFIIAVDLNSKQALGEPSNIGEILIKSFQITLSGVVKEQIKKADVKICPDLSSFNMYDVKQAEDLIKKGHEEALAVFESLNIKK